MCKLNLKADTKNGYWVSRKCVKRDNNGSHQATGVTDLKREELKKDGRRGDAVQWKGGTVNEAGNRIFRPPTC